MDDGHKGKKGIVIVAGGTGGHIMPAIAIGEALLRQSPSVPLLYLCGSKPIERGMYERFGIQPVSLSVMPLYRSVRSRIAGGVRLMHSFGQSVGLLRRRGGVVLGMGSYVSAPVLAAARLLRIPYYVHEQNSVPGKTNRFFARAAQTFFCSYRMTDEALNGIRTCTVGAPVRSSLTGANPQQGRAFFEIAEQEAVLLVIGGSQGAQFLNHFTLATLEEINKSLSAQKRRVHVIWSTGGTNEEECRKELEGTELGQIRVSLFPFIERMDMAYAAADVALCRAGASTLAELSAMRVPAVLIPLPYARDNHQYYNARAYVDAGAALMYEQSSADPHKVADTLVNLLFSPERRAEMAKGAARMDKPDAAERIANALYQEIKNQG